VVEQAPTAQLFARPRHPYTAALLAASPEARAASATARPSLLAGHVPQAGQFPAGCRFHPRCPYVEDACRDGPLALEVVGERRLCRCRRAHELALPGVGVVDATPMAADGAGGP
jgi:oligopeptide/dipeptide ABC transporter ATP-binding protein